MKYIISKEQYRRVLLKYLNSFVGGFIVDPHDGSAFRNVVTSNGDDFATLWHGGQITKGCKRELTLDNQFLNEFESFIPIKRKKVFSQVILEYFALKTGIKCNCVEFNYYTGKYKEYEVFGDGDEIITRIDKETDHYQYKIPKKR